jgi:NTE family protein
LAHVGVLSVLKREGIPIHCIAGTSAGSLIGAFYCAGMSVERIRELALAIKWWHLARPVFPIRGFVTFSPLQRWLVRTLGDIRIEDLRLPLAVVATDLDQGKPFAMCEGPLAPAVRASCSVPGFVTPLVHQGRTLCDGGISDNLPVDAVRALGAEFVIGVNLFDPFFNRPRTMFGFGFSAIETLVRRAGGGIEACDCLISPDLVGQTYLRFSKKLELIRRGEIAAQAQIPCIRERVGIG